MCMYPTGLLTSQGRRQSQPQYLDAAHLRKPEMNLQPLSVLQCSDGNSAQDNSSLKRVAVVEDFFDIIYAMHVEMGADPGRAPKHAGQKKTYKAVSASNT